VTLALADPVRLNREEGIPEDANLVHKKLLESKLQKEKNKSEMEALQQAAGDRSAHKSQTAKSRLLRRRK
jgi:hypothetical protein